MEDWVIKETEREREEEGKDVGRKKRISHTP